MEILELINTKTTKTITTTATKQPSLDGSNSKMEITIERASEFKYKSIEVSNLNYRVKRIENKMNRASGSCEIRLKVLIFVSQKKRIMSVVQKKIFE